MLGKLMYAVISEIWDLVRVILPQKVIRKALGDEKKYRLLIVIEIVATFIADTRKLDFRMLCSQLVAF